MVKEMSLVPYNYYYQRSSLIMEIFDEFMDLNVEVNKKEEILGSDLQKLEKPFSVFCVLLTTYEP